MLLKKSKTKEIILFADQASGSYAEYRGLKPYIDNRSEIFLKVNNKKEDIYKEYFMLQKGYIYYKDIMNKYNFNYVIIRDKQVFFEQIIKDKNYKLIYYAPCESKSLFKFGDGNYYILEKNKISAYRNILIKN